MACNFNSQNAAVHFGVIYAYLSAMPAVICIHRCMLTLLWFSNNGPPPQSSRLYCCRVCRMRQCMQPCDERRSLLWFYRSALAGSLPHEVEAALPIRWKCGPLSAPLQSIMSFLASLTLCDPIAVSVWLGCSYVQLSPCH